MTNYPRGSVAPSAHPGMSLPRELSVACVASSLRVAPASDVACLLPSGLTPSHKQWETAHLWARFRVWLTGRYVNRFLASRFKIPSALVLQTFLTLTGSLPFKANHQYQRSLFLHPNQWREKDFNLLWRRVVLQDVAPLAVALPLLP